MATDFPTSLDALTNPTPSDNLDSGAVPHASQHANINDAMEAVQAKVGVDNSAVTTSLDYKIRQLEGLAGSGNFAVYLGEGYVKFAGLWHKIIAEAQGEAVVLALEQVGIAIP